MKDKHQPKDRYPHNHPIMPKLCRTLGIMGFLFLMSIFSVIGQETLTLSEDFNDNLTAVLNRGWVKGNVTWNGNLNITNPAGFLYQTDGYSGTQPASLYNGNLTYNMSFAKPFRVVTEIKQPNFSSINYNIIGLVNNVNRTGALSHFLFISMAEDNGAQFSSRVQTDGVYCKNNYTGYFDITPRTTNNILYNFTFAVINTTHGTLGIINNKTNIYYNYSYNCTNTANLTFVVMTRTPSSFIDYVRVYDLSGNFTANISNVTINSPANNSFVHTPLIANYRFTGNVPSANCTLFINDTLYNSTVIASNNTNTNLSVNLTDGNYSFYVNCFNSTTSYNSSLYTIVIDNINPSIAVLSPLNHSVMDKRLNLTGYATNTNLDIVNLTIRDINSTLYYSFYEENITASIKVFTNATINTTLWADGLYNILISVKDSANNTIFYQSDFNIVSCFPDWVCIGYLPCNISDLTLCDNVTDANNCEDESYTGNFLEYGNFSCDYCVPILYNLSPAVCVANIRNYSVQNVNFATCCNITNLSSDCVYNGYNMKDFNGLLAFYENCQMPPQEIDFGFDVVLIIIIIICMVLVWLGITTSFSVFALLGGLGLVFCGGFIVEIPAIKIFLILIGIVTILIWAMLMYNEA